MKKAKKIVAVILSLFLIFLVMINLSAIRKLFNNELLCYAIKPDDCEEDDSLPSDDSSKYNYTFLQSYYRGLTENMGANTKGSCGYVSIGMILSYYDTYLNDDIIPEIYDAVSEGEGTDMIARGISPGIRNDDVKCDDNNEYLNIMREKATDKEYPSLHAKLITIGADLGYYNFKETYPCGLIMSQQKKVMLEYLKEQGYTENADFTITTCYDSSDKVKKFVKENIDAGYPVMIDVYHSQGAGHSCVAYDYVGDKIYANMGWSNREDRAHHDVGLSYSVFKSAMVLKFNMEHSHSNNYVVTNADGSKDYYCWDNCKIITCSQITHKYTDHYIIDDTTHTAYCACGISITEEHSYTDSYNSKLNETTHTAYCVCGAYKVEEHDYTDHYKYTNLYHIYYCECGKSQQGMHRWGKIIMVGGIEYAVCRECDFARKVGNGFYPSIDLRI